MPTDEKDKIKEDIQKTGLPLEIDTNEILSSMGWNVGNQSYYLDQVEHKTRYVDLVASKLEIINGPTLKRLNVTLIIECKRSFDKPWVFYMVPKGEMHQPTFGQMYLVKFSSQPDLPPPQYKLFWHSHYFLKDVKEIAIRSYVAFNEGKDGINEAINQSLKALIYRKKETSGLLRRLPQKYWGGLMIYYPIVVFEGRMYEYGRKGNDLELSGTNYLQYQVSYGISDSVAEETYLVDVVRKEFLREYLTWLDDEISLICAEGKA